MDVISDTRVDASPTAGTDFFPGSPLRPPDWRWLRAGQYLVPGTRRGRRDDAWVIRARRSRAALARLGGHTGDPRLARADPDIHGACRLSLGPGRPRWEVEARLLAEHGPFRHE